MFDRDGFIKYMEDNYSLDDFSINLLNNLIEYGEKKFTSKWGITDFLYDVLEGEGTYIDYKEIEQFYDWERRNENE